VIEDEVAAVRRRELRLVVGVLVGWALLMAAIVGGVMALRGWMFSRARS
jgi:hypothetical protein